MESQNNQLQLIDADVIASLVINGEVGKLTADQKVQYYNYRCQQVGLDPSAKPFDLLRLNGKEILYANAACTQQLTSIHKLSHCITKSEVIEGIYMVCVRVTGNDGRSTENMGCVPIGSLKGDNLANGLMKATTKAIRRAVLAHCGLGMLDETETETIPNAVPLQMPDVDTTYSSVKGAPLTIKADPFKIKYNTISEIDIQLERADEVEHVVALFYANADLIETDAEFKKKVGDKRDELKERDFYYANEDSALHPNDQMS